MGLVIDEAFPSGDTGERREDKIDMFISAKLASRTKASVTVLTCAETTPGFFDGVRRAMTVTAGFGLFEWLVKEVFQ